MARSRKYELGVGCLLLGAMVVLAFMALQVGALAGFGDRIDVSSRFDDAAGLQPGAAVSISGVNVGTVEGLTLDQGFAVVALRLDPGAQVRKDARVRIRARSVLGEKYVELEAGNPAAPLAVDGDVLVAAGRQVEIDEMVAMMAPLVEALDPETVAAVMDKLDARLQEDPELISRLLDNADRLLTNAANASDRLPVLLDGADSALSQTRGTLGEVRARAVESKQVLARADRILLDVEGVTGDLPELVAEIEGGVGDARKLILEVDQSTDGLELILDNLSAIDKTEIRRLLREEGILVRLFPKKVDPEDGSTKKERARRDQ